MQRQPQDLVLLQLGVQRLLSEVSHAQATGHLPCVAYNGEGRLWVAFLPLGDMHPQKAACFPALWPDPAAAKLSICYRVFQRPGGLCSETGTVPSYSVVQIIFDCCYNCQSEPVLCSTASFRMSHLLAFVGILFGSFISLNTCSIAQSTVHCSRFRGLSRAEHLEAGFRLHA